MSGDDEEYCLCKLTDPEQNLFGLVMYQCETCGGWYHGECIGQELNEDVDFICAKCPGGAPFKSPLEGAPLYYAAMVRADRGQPGYLFDWDYKLTMMREGGNPTHGPTKLTPPPKVTTSKAKGKSNDSKKKKPLKDNSVIVLSDNPKRTERKRKSDTGSSSSDDDEGSSSSDSDDSSSSSSDSDDDSQESDNDSEVSRGKKSSGIRRENSIEIVSGPRKAKTKALERVGELIALTHDTDIPMRSGSSSSSGSSSTTSSLSRMTTASASITPQKQAPRRMGTQPVPSTVSTTSTSSSSTGGRHSLQGARMSAKAAEEAKTMETRKRFQEKLATIPLMNAHIAKAIDDALFKKVGKKRIRYRDMNRDPTESPYPIVQWSS